MLHRSSAGRHALGEVLGPAAHPLVPTLNSVISACGGGEPFDAAVTSRRFCLTFGREGFEVLEFAWMGDGRCVVFYRWGEIGGGGVGLREGEYGVYSGVGGEWGFGECEFRLGFRGGGCGCAGKGVGVGGVCGCGRAAVKVGVVAGGDGRDVWKRYCEEVCQVQASGSIWVRYEAGGVGVGVGLGGRGKVIGGGGVEFGVQFSAGMRESWRTNESVQMHVEKSGMGFVMLEEPSRPAQDILRLMGADDMQPVVEEGDVIWVDGIDGLLGLEKSVVGLEAGIHGGVFDAATVLDISSPASAAAMAAAAPSSSGSVPLSLASSLAPVPEQLLAVPRPPPPPATTTRRPRAPSNGIDKHSSSSSSSATTCDICGANFTRPSNLRRHVQSLHMRVKRRHACARCDRSFFSALELKRHSATHDAPRPQCPECGMRFRLPSALDLHIAVSHANARPFVCEMCDASFARKSACDRHRKSVHEKRRHQCLDCGASYSQPFDLKRHRQKSGHVSGAETFASPPAANMSEAAAREQRGQRRPSSNTSAPSPSLHDLQLAAQDVLVPTLSQPTLAQTPRYASHHSDETMLTDVAAVPESHHSGTDMRYGNSMEQHVFGLQDQTGVGPQTASSAPLASGAYVDESWAAGCAGILEADGQLQLNMLMPSTR